MLKYEYNIYVHYQLLYYDNILQLLGLQSFFLSVKIHLIKYIGLTQTVNF